MKLLRGWYFAREVPVLAPGGGGGSVHQSGPVLGGPRTYSLFFWVDVYSAHLPFGPSGLRTRS